MAHSSSYKLTWVDKIMFPLCTFVALSLLVTVLGLIGYLCVVLPFHLIWAFRPWTFIGIAVILFIISLIFPYED